MNDTSGPISSTPLAYLDPDGSYWRMSQGILALVPPKPLQILPPFGISVDGELFQLAPPERLTNANDFSLLPTPRAQNGETRNMNIWKRPLDQPQNLENALARLSGDDTSQPFDDGNKLLDE